MSFHYIYARPTLLWGVLCLPGWGLCYLSQWIMADWAIMLFRPQPWIWLSGSIDRYSFLVLVSSLSRVLGGQNYSLVVYRLFVWYRKVISNTSITVHSFWLTAQDRQLRSSGLFYRSPSKSLDLIKGWLGGILPPVSVLRISEILTGNMNSSSSAYTRRR